ncbi:MAG: hypothetical protein GY845_37330 [Planctomycetes bacterium]|nr:hypothetical protein [Planctomycetota bacterium]
MDNFDRLEKMLAGVDFMSFPDLTADDAMKEFEDHYEKPWQKLGPERSERVKTLLWGLVADRLQPEAQQRYGDASDASIRSTLAEWVKEFDRRDVWQEAFAKAQFMWMDEGITEEEMDLRWSWTLTYWADFLADGAQPWDLLSRSTASDTVDVLALMFKETANADYR